MPLTVTETIRLGEAARAVIRKWHESSGKHTTESLDIFEEGFKDGWSQCLRTLKQHGYKFEDPHR